MFSITKIKGFERAQANSMMSAGLVTGFFLLADHRTPLSAAMLLAVCAICVVMTMRNGPASTLVTALSKGPAYSRVSPA